MRSHSTDKQASNFISKLDSKVAQLTNSGAQDDSGMMRGVSNGGGTTTSAQNKPLSQFKKAN